MQAAAAPTIPATSETKNTRRYREDSWLGGAWIRTKIDGVRVPNEALILFAHFANHRRVSQNGSAPACRPKVRTLAALAANFSALGSFPVAPAAPPISGAGIS